MHPAVYWIIGALVALILEMMVPAFVIGSFGVSAFFAALAAWFGASLPIQIVVCGVLGFLFVVPARKYLHRQGPTLRMSAETMAGKLAMCVEPIGGDTHVGTVQLDGARWTATAPRGTHIAPGTMVEILAVVGARLVVAPRASASPTPSGAPPTLPTHPKEPTHGASE